MCCDGILSFILMSTLETRNPRAELVFYCEFKKAKKCLELDKGPLTLSRNRPRGFGARSMGELSGLAQLMAVPEYEGKS